jgi:hypothetical protein
MDRQVVGCEGMDWFELACDRDRWRALVNAVMILRVSKNAGNFLTSCKPVSFSRRTLLHGLNVIVVIIIITINCFMLCLCFFCGWGSASGNTKKCIKLRTCYDDLIRGYQPLHQIIELYYGENIIIIIINCLVRPLTPKDL